MVSEKLTADDRAWMTAAAFAPVLKKFLRIYDAQEAQCAGALTHIQKTADDNSKRALQLEEKCEALTVTLERVRAVADMYPDHDLAADLKRALGPAQAEPTREPFEKLTNNERRDLLRGVPAYDERAKALRIIDQLTEATGNRVEYWLMATEAAEARCAEIEQQLHIACKAGVSRLSPGQAAVLKAMARLTHDELIQLGTCGNNEHDIAEAELARRESEK